MRAVVGRVYTLVFYGLVGGTATLLWPFLRSRERAIAVFAAVMRGLLRLQAWWGLGVEVRGLEHLPQAGGVIAAKHQSIWETFALFTVVPNLSIVHKRELYRVPVFGAWLKRLDLIPVDREGGAAALRGMRRDVAAAVAAGRRVVVFPEGTRRAPGMAPDYKVGVSLLYAQLKQPVTPMVLTSGLFWSATGWRGGRGTVVVECLPPIPPGLSSAECLAELERVMEAASDRLLLEAAARGPCDGWPLSARARLAALRQGPSGAPGGAGAAEGTAAQGLQAGASEAS